MWGWEKKLVYYGYEKGRFLRIKNALKDDNIRYHTLIEKYELSNGLIDEEMMKINEHYENNKDNTSVYF